MVKKHETRLGDKIHVQQDRWTPTGQKAAQTSQRRYCYGKKRKEMNQIFPLISTVLMFTLIPLIFGAYIKLSARVLRYNGITWKQSFVFGLIMVICNGLVRGTSFGFGYSLPFVPSILLGLVVNCLIGSWYFSGRVDSTEGGTLGWTKALKLTGLAVSMIGLTGTILIGVGKIFS